MLRQLATAAALLAATPALAQQPALAPAPAPAPASPASAPIRVLFIGNSFTQGAHQAVRNWHAGTVTDLDRAGHGGVPAWFKAFADQPD